MNRLRFGCSASCITTASNTGYGLLTEPFETIVTDALDKLGIKWELGSAIRDYNAGNII